MKIKVARTSTGIEEYRKIKNVILSGKFVSGKNVLKFEQNFSKYLGLKYGVAFNSGTAALHSALNALGLKKYDEVIVPSISFMSSATSILQQNCTPIFCDVNLDTYCIDVEDLKRRITKKTKAIIVVHFAGNACDMKEIIKIAKKNKLFIIEDCAQAHGTTYKNKKVGTFGNIACFSFYATKHMTTGEGGILCTNSKTISAISKSFRNHGMIDRDTHKTLGYNYRMNEISAVIGLEQLKKLDKINSKRIKNSKYLLSKLKKIDGKWFEAQDFNSNIKHTYFWCPIKIIDKKVNLDKVKKKLLQKGIEIRSRYKSPLYKQAVIQNLKIQSSQNYKKLHLPNAEKLAGNIFGLPNHHDLKKKELDYIVESIKNINV